MMRRRSTGPLALLAAVALLVTGIDALAGPAPDPGVVAPTPVEVEPRAGSVVCAVGLGGPGAPPVGLPEVAPPPEPDDEDAADPDTEAADPDTEAEGDDAPDDPDAPDAPDEGDDTTPEVTGPAPAELVIARPGGPGSSPAQLERLDLLDDATPRVDLPAVFPGGEVRTRGPIDEATPAASVVRWRDGAVAVHREWRLDGLDGYPPALVAGPCTRSSAGIHVVPGLSTDGGNEARLRLANPHLSPASVAVRFATPGEVEAPLALRNISVPPRSVRELVVNDTLPERTDLAALVEVTSGRLAVEGLQLARAAIGGVDGASLLASTTRPGESWTVPWLVDDDDHASWLWVVNLGERTASVELTLHTEDGGELPLGLSQVSVPEGELRRVDLTGTLPEGVTEVALTARSNGVPIVVSGGVVRADEQAERTGLAVQLGAAASSRWVTSGRAGEDRREVLVISNPEGEPAIVDITFFAGVQAVAPESLREVEVPAGSRRLVDLQEALPASGGWTAFVSARQGAVVVGRVGSTDGSEPLELVASPATSSAQWLATSSGLRPTVRPGLVTQLGTSGSRAGVEVPGGLLRPEEGEPEEGETDDDGEETSPDEPAG